MELAVMVGLLPSILAAVGVWVNLNGSIEKLKARVYYLESERAELKQMLKELRDAVEEIRVSVASR